MYVTVVVKNVAIGARTVRRAIIDKDVTIPRKPEISYDPAAD